MSTISAAQTGLNTPSTSTVVPGRKRRRLGVAKRDSLLPFSMSDFEESDLDELRAILDPAAFRQGTKTAEFEKAFAKFVGVKHAIAVDSFASALNLSFAAIGIKQGDEVITSPYTFSGVIQAAQYSNAKPVLSDVEQETLNIAPENIEHAITSQTRAIAPAHAGGLPSNMQAILELAQKHNIPVIESASRTIPARESGRHIGQHGNIVCFSFDVESPIDAGRGGMICVNDDELARECRRLLLGNPQHEEQNWISETHAPTCYAPMAQLNAAVALIQLRRAEQHWQRRREIAVTYNAIFSSFVELECPHESPESQHAWHMYPLRLNQRHLTINREQFIDELWQRNIEATVRLVPVHVRPNYSDQFTDSDECCPVAIREFEREVALPIYGKMDDQDVKDVADAVMDVVARFRC